MNEHMPVGGLVAPINCNDSQALSDGNIDDLRSDCHDAAVLLDDERPSILFAIRRIWVNDRAWASRRYRWHTTSLPQLIRTTRRVEYALVTGIAPGIPLFAISAISREIEFELFLDPNMGQK